MTLGLISSIMVSIEILQRVANDSFDKLSTCSLNLNADCPKFPKNAFNIHESIFKLFCSINTGLISFIIKSQSGPFYPNSLKIRGFLRFPILLQPLKDARREVVSLSILVF